MSVDEREEQQMMIDRVAEQYGETIEFTLLSDPDHAVIDRYGLFNPDESRGRPVPHPTVMVIDRDGVVRWRFTEVNYRVRAENEDILEALEAIESEEEPSAGTDRGPSDAGRGAGADRVAGGPPEP